jgi:hypothetical protein
MKGIKLSKPWKVLLLDDEPVVGKRLKPGMTRIGCEAEIFEDSRKTLGFAVDVKTGAGHESNTQHTGR